MRFCVFDCVCKLWWAENCLRMVEGGLGLCRTSCRPSHYIFGTAPMPVYDNNLKRFLIILEVDQYFSLNRHFKDIFSWHFRLRCGSAKLSV